MMQMRRVDALLGPILEDGAKIMFFIFSGAALLVCLLYQSISVPHPFSLDYGEAPLVDQAMRLSSGQNIYRADISSPPYTISNYPPVYVSLVAIGVKLFGAAKAFTFGRIISVTSTWAASLLLMLIVYAQTRDRIASLSAGLVLPAFPFVVYWSPLLRIDMLALALSLGGLCLLVWKPPTNRQIMGVAVLLVAAIYTRQSYGLAAPLAAFVWLLPRDWRQALRLALIVGGLGLFLFLVLNAITHGGFFFNIVTANVNEFSSENLEWNLDRLRQAALLPLLIAVASLFLSPRWNPLWTLVTPYLIGAAISASTIGKVGSNVNYLLELCAALSLTMGAVVAWSRAHLSLYSLRAAVLFLVAAAVLHLVHVTVQDYTWDIRDHLAAKTELYELEQLVSEAEGPILADEYMSMLTLQGRPLFIQPFEVTQLALAGKWDQTPLIKSINNKEFAAIILFDQPWSKERWTPETLSAISKSYVLVDKVAGNLVYKAFEPRATSKIEACPGSSWRLPSDGSFGIQSVDERINFFGQGNEASIPVYAVADGFLTRPSDWVDAVAILHQDPLRPEEKVWVYYGGMAAANGTDSFVAADFPAGSSNIPVKSGQLLGYQGKWSVTPLRPKWVHMFLLIVDAHGRDSFPTNVRFTDMLEPAPYLGLMMEAGNENPQSLKCE